MRTRRSVSEVDFGQSSSNDVFHPFKNTSWTNTHTDLLSGSNLFDSSIPGLLFFFKFQFYLDFKNKI